MPRLPTFQAKPIRVLFPLYFTRKRGFWFPENIKLVSNKKRNPTAAHLSTLPQGSSTNRITNKEDVVKTQESANPNIYLKEDIENATRTDDMFAVSPEVAEKFRSDVKNFLENEQIPGSQKLDMGMLPPIYVKLGLSEGELKTNKMTLLKALGKAGKHKHNVPQNVLENLIGLMSDPLAVFKSSAKSQNPNGYVAVLNAQNEEGKQIVAILSPKSEKHEFSFIPSVYERNKFEMFVKNTLAENGVLYIKDEAALPSLHNAVLRTNTASKSESSHLYLRGVPINRILTKEDVVKAQESGATPTGGQRKKINIPLVSLAL